MARVVIEFATDNAADLDTETPEVIKAHVRSILAVQMWDICEFVAFPRSHGEMDTMSLLDSNGNTVGKVTVE